MAGTRKCRKNILRHFTWRYSKSPCIEVDDVTSNKKADEYYPGLFFSSALFPTPLRNNPFSLFLLCGLIVGQTMIVNGLLVITIPMLERNFGYSSIETGIINSVYDVCFGVSALLSGMVGRKRKLFVVGMGGLLIAFGSVLFTLPNFLVNFKGLAPNLKKSTQEQLNLPTDTASALCGRSSKFVGAPTKLAKNCVSNTSGIHLVIFCIAYGVIGLGSAPLHALSIAYFDEHLTPQSSGIYLGIFYLFGAVGPAVGFVLGKPFLSLPVTLNLTSYWAAISPHSKDWIGAWWLGYLVAAAVVLVFGLLLAAYPSKVPPEKSHPATNDDVFISEALAVTKIENFGSYFSSFRYLFHNRPYMAMVMAFTLESILVRGVGTFLAKILQVQFRVSPQNASLYAGGLVVIGVGFGTISGGIITKIRKDKPKVKSLLILVMSFFIGCCYASFFLGCNKVEVSGIELDDTNIVNRLETVGCNSHCGCDVNSYQPACDTNYKLTYYSPCVAGCNNFTFGIGFTNCSCLASSVAPLKQGVCVKGCKTFVYFLIGVLVTLFLQYLTYVPQLTLMLSYLNEQTKNPGLGLQQILGRIGYIAGPFIFGYIIDSSCSMWSRNKCTLASANCLEYDTETMRVHLPLCAILIRVFTTMLHFASYLFTSDD